MSEQTVTAEEIFLEAQAGLAMLHYAVLFVPHVEVLWGCHLMNEKNGFPELLIGIPLTGKQQVFSEKVIGGNKKGLAKNR